MNYLLSGITHAFDLLVHGDPSTYSAIFITIKASLSSSIISLCIGIPLGYKLGNSHFPGKKTLRILVNTALSLPTVLIGLIVYLLVSSQGPLGGLNLLFTIYAIVIGQTILALPLVIALTASAIEHLDRSLPQRLQTLGATSRQVMLTMLWETRFAILVMMLTVYGRVVSEVGISMMVGGNIKWFTRTITTAIALDTNKGEFATSIALGMVLLLFALSVNFIMSVFKTNKVRP